MTKIKNTKKGMAKKTLSMSLVVAMLATSNVPVWAAEFSDGTDAAVETEAPAAETFSDDATEAPVVENTTDVTDVATATAPKLTLANWTGALAVSGDLKDGSTDVANFDYKVRIDGKEVVGSQPVFGRILAVLQVDQPVFQIARHAKARLHAVGNKIPQIKLGL